MAKTRKFNRTPKLEDLVPRLREAGLGLNVLPTYMALCEHANNTTGKAWPSVNRIAGMLGLCRRTVERHLSALCEAGLVLRGAQRRGARGRYSTRVYAVVAVLFFKRATVRHGERPASRSSNKERTKRTLNPDKRHLEAERRREGYEWLFE